MLKGEFFTTALFRVFGLPICPGNSPEGPKDAALPKRTWEPLGLRAAYKDHFLDTV